MGSLQIDLLGTSFAIQANEDDTYLQKLLTYYKRITSQIEESGHLKDSLQVSILSGIMLCDELYKEKSKRQKYAKTVAGEDDEDAEQLTLDMIAKIDRVLKKQDASQN